MSRKPRKSTDETADDDGSSSKRRYQAPALEKGLDILELLSSEKDGLSQKEISTKLGRSIHELFRMLVCLEERGYVLRGGNREKLVLSPKLFELGLRYPPTERLVHAAGPRLLEMASTTRQACHISIQSGGNVLVVAQQNSPEKLCLMVSLGTTVPLHDAVSGVVLLAFKEPRVRAHWLSQTTATKKEISNLDAAYASVLKNGYYSQPSKAAQGVTELAFPIFAHTGYAVATLSVPILHTFQAETEIDLVVEHGLRTAREISRQIGWHSA